MSRLSQLLDAYDRLRSPDERRAFARQVRDHVLATGFQPHTQPAINNGVPRSALETIHRRFMFRQSNRQERKCVCVPLPLVF
jgi:hypothetical protein